MQTDVHGPQGGGGGGGVRIRDDDTVDMIGTHSCWSSQIKSVSINWFYHRSGSTVASVYCTMEWIYYRVGLL